ncbi:hypothetical protein NPIL_154311 [Nephila pilipes]|uniref:Uncharacterized protein n=1 Tax=Nephila pilipes TaxID=299642 RepID=A0A8X6QL50_NEPPI|nr:hypothetical protein NPIL_154311 [Nephila pilipes]
MLTKIIFICVVLAEVQARKPDELSYERAPFLASKFLGLPPTFVPKGTNAGHTTISQNTFIDHVAHAGIAGNIASTGVSSNNYADIGLSSGILRASAVGKAVISEPSTIGIRTVIDHLAPAAISGKTATVAISSAGYADNGVPAAGLLTAPIYGKGAIVPPSSSVIDHAASVGVSTASTNVPSLGYADSGILSTEFIGSIDKSVIATPAAVSYDSAIEHVAPSTYASASSNGLLSPGYSGNNIFSSGMFGTLMGKTSIAAPSIIASNSHIDHISPENIAVAAPAQISSINYAAPIAGKAVIEGPTGVTTRTSVIKHIAAPEAPTTANIGNGYAHSGILSNNLLGFPVASMLGIDGKNIFNNDLFSISNIANNGLLSGGILSEPFNYNNGKLMGGLTGATIVGDAITSPTKYSTVIDHVAPTSINRAPVAVNGINGNGLFGDNLGHTSLLRMANGLFGISYDGLFGNEATKLNLNTFLSKYH